MMIKPSYRVINYQGGTPSQNQFYYNLYAEFYNNETRFMPELFSLVGVKYFVIMNNLTGISSGLGFGLNITKLMKYQSGIVEITKNKYYELYESKYNIRALEVIKNFTLVLGNFNTLNYLNYIGMNLTQTPIIFSSDINKNDARILLPHVNTIITSEFTNYINFTKNLTKYCSKVKSYEFEGDVNSGKISLLEIITPLDISIVQSKGFCFRYSYPSGYCPGFLYISNKNNTQSVFRVNPVILHSYVAIASGSTYENHNYTINGAYPSSINYINSFTHTFWSYYNHSFNNSEINFTLKNDSKVLYSQSWIKFVLVSNSKLRFSRSGKINFSTQEEDNINFSFTYTNTGYEIQTNHTGLLISYIPYYSDMISKGGNSFPALGSVISIIVVSNSHKYSNSAYSFYLTIYGIFGILSFFGSYFTIRRRILIN